MYSNAFFYAYEAVGATAVCSPNLVAEPCRYFSESTACLPSAVTSGFAEKGGGGVVLVVCIRAGSVIIRT